MGLPKNEEYKDYYKNLTEEDVRNCIDIESTFLEYEFEVDTEHKDLQFWGIKND